MKIFAAFSILLLAACASHDCRNEPPLSLQHARSTLHLPATASVDAQAVDAQDVRSSKPQIFANVPDGCYWRVTFRARLSPSQERTGVALFRAADGSLFRESATIVKYY